MVLAIPPGVQEEEHSTHLFASPSSGVEMLKGVNAIKSHPAFTKAQVYVLIQK